jgi:hypothetical protein
MATHQSFAQKKRDYETQRVLVLKQCEENGIPFLDNMDGKRAAKVEVAYAKQPQCHQQFFGDPLKDKDIEDTIEDHFSRRKRGRPHHGC